MIVYFMILRFNNLDYFSIIEHVGLFSPFTKPRNLVNFHFSTNILNLNTRVNCLAMKLIYANFYFNLYLTFPGITSLYYWLLVKQPFFFHAYKDKTLSFQHSGLIKRKKNNLIPSTRFLIAF